MKLGSFENDMLSSSSVLPPLMDSPPPYTTTTINETSHVTCFSDPMEDHNKPTTQQDTNNNNNNMVVDSSVSVSPVSPFNKFSVSFSNSVFPNQYPDAFLFQDQSILKILMEPNIKLNTTKPEFSQDSVLSNQDDPSTGPVDLDCFWNY